MLQKIKLRKKFLKLRKKRYYEINKDFFSPLIKLIKKNYKKKQCKLALYYPTNFEVNVLKILDNNYFINKKILLPVVEKNNSMNFYRWKKNGILIVNDFGILEPLKSKIEIPNILLIPLLSFDDYNNRLGYGKGFYDRFLNKYIKKFKNILTVGVAFSFQRYHKLPVTKKDIKLDFVLTEKELIE